MSSVQVVEQEVDGVVKVVDKLEQLLPAKGFLVGHELVVQRRMKERMDAERVRGKVQYDKHTRHNDEHARRAVLRAHPRLRNTQLRLRGRMWRRADASQRMTRMRGALSRQE